MSALFGVGKKSADQLARYGITTIGELAKCSEEWLAALFGVCGREMWLSANGLNRDRVAPDNYKEESKSIGHGVTCKEDLENNEEIWKVFLALSQNVAKRLRFEKLNATGVQISVRDNRFITKQFQCRLENPSQSASEIAKAATELFKLNYSWVHCVRALTVRAINLTEENNFQQMDFYTDYGKLQKQKSIDDTVMKLRQKFGEDVIFNCCLMDEEKMPVFLSDEKAPSPFKAFK